MCIYQEIFVFMVIIEWPQFNILTQSVYIIDSVPPDIRNVLQGQTIRLNVKQHACMKGGAICI